MPQKRERVLCGGECVSVCTVQFVAAAVELQCSCRQRFTSNNKSHNNKYVILILFKNYYNFNLFLFVFLLNCCKWILLRGFSFLEQVKWLLKNLAITSPPKVLVVVDFLDSLWEEVVDVCYVSLYKKWHH